MSAGKNQFKRNAVTGASSSMVMGRVNAICIPSCPKGFRVTGRQVRSIGAGATAWRER